MWNISVKVKIFLIYSSCCVSFGAAIMVEKNISEILY